MSRNRQVGLPAEYARRMGIKPGEKLISSLVWLPGAGHMVVLMPKPVSYAKDLAALIAGDAPAGSVSYVRKLRREWRKRG